MAAYAIMLNGSTDDIGPTANGLEYAIDLDNHDHEVTVYFDGASTQWPGLLSKKPDHPVNKYFEEVSDRGLIGGACGYCAHAFDGVEGCEETGIELIGGAENHGPDVGELVSNGIQLITVG